VKKIIIYEIVFLACIIICPKSLIFEKSSLPLPERAVFPSKVKQGTDVEAGVACDKSG
jgi:hypothetical protein